MNSTSSVSAHRQSVSSRLAASFVFHNAVYKISEMVNKGAAKINMLPSFLFLCKPFFVCVSLVRALLALRCTSTPLWLLRRSSSSRVSRDLICVRVGGWSGSRGGVGEGVRCTATTSRPTPTPRTSPRHSRAPLRAKKSPHRNRTRIITMPSARLRLFITSPLLPGYIIHY